MFQSCWIPLILENAMIFCFPPLMSIFLPPSYNTPYCKHYQNNFSRNIPTLWSIKIWLILSIVAIQELNCVQLFEIPWTTFQVPLSSTISQSLLKFMSIELVMLSNHLILCHPLLSSIFPSIRVFSNESAVHISIR